MTTSTDTVHQDIVSTLDIDETLCQVITLVGLSGMLDMWETCRNVIIVNKSFYHGVVGSFKGINSCWNPELLFLPSSLNDGEKFKFLENRVHSSLKRLSLDGVSTQALTYIKEHLTSLESLHLYGIYNYRSKDQNKDNTNEDTNLVNLLNSTLNSVAGNLIKLTLDRFPFSSEFLNSLANMTNLTQLELSYPRRLKNESKSKENNGKSIKNNGDSDTNLTENDWLVIAQHCKNLERLRISWISGLNMESLKQLKRCCKKLCYFDTNMCRDIDYVNDNLNAMGLSMEIGMVFKEQLKGLSMWNESGLSIERLATLCDNLEELSITETYGTSMHGTSSFKNLKKLALRRQRYVESDVLNEIAIGCTKLEEFTFTNEFPGKHSLSHDLLCFLQGNTFKTLKKFSTNGETCSLRMAKLIKYYKPQIEICCAYNQCDIFSKRYEQALLDWDEECHCQDHCPEYGLFNQMEKSKQSVKMNAKHNGTSKCCANCGKDESDGKLQRCSQCKKTYYCSRKCQVKDWKKRHKKQCKNL